MLSIWRAAMRRMAASTSGLPAGCAGGVCKPWAASSRARAASSVRFIPPSSMLSQMAALRPCVWRVAVAPAVHVGRGDPLLGQDGGDVRAVLGGVVDGLDEDDP